MGTNLIHARSIPAAARGPARGVKSALTLAALLWFVMPHARVARAADVRAPEVSPGVEVLVSNPPEELRGKRVAILTNPTGVDRELNSTIDLVRAIPSLTVVRLFAPEHGIRGVQYAGEKVRDDRDPVSGLPVLSLHGRTRRPTPEMLAGLDAVLYDIQDVGSRSYTYVSTLTYMMEACEAAGVAVWVLDRPDPLGGLVVGGPMMHDGLRSFIGVHNVPLVYGMTPGEWARMIHAERTPGLELRVVPMHGWKRGMTYGDLGWAWIPPSQHIPRWETSAFYVMTGTIGELGRLSEGVGTPLPFELMGAPWLDGPRFASEMNALGLPGVRFRATSFSPRYGTHTGKICNGAQIHVSDFGAVDPARIGLELMAALVRIAPEQGIFADGRLGRGSGAKPSMFLKALGDARLGEALAENRDPRAEGTRIEDELANFLTRRAKYLIYE